MIHLCSFASHLSPSLPNVILSLIVYSICFCPSWRAYANTSLVSMTNNVCYSPPRSSRTIVALLSSSRLRRTMCSSQSASHNSPSTPMIRSRGPASLRQNPVQKCTSSCSPLTRPSTPDRSGSTRDWASLAATPSTVYPFFPKRSSLPLPLSTLNQDPLTGFTL